MKRFLWLVAASLITACAPIPTDIERTPKTQAALKPVEPRLQENQALKNFVNVAETVIPVSEDLCRSMVPDQNCDFQLSIVADPDAPPNAFQSLSRTGQPIIGFTQALIKDARNTDELAFIMGHEAAHHIQRHLGRRAANASLFGFGGRILGGLVDVPELGERVGSAVGSRAFSKNHELEADSLGTIIAARAGYDPVKGSQYFARIPDPGNVFLGTHPPNPERIATVRRVAAGL